MKNNYSISRDSKTGEVIYLEYDKNGYKVNPKIRRDDAIEVSKIVFVSPSLTKKLLKKKINSKISKLLLELNTFYDEDNGDPDSGASKVRNMLKEAKKLQFNLINNYKKYLDGNYVGLTLKKLQVIIDGYNSRMQAMIDKKRKQIFNDILFETNYDFEENAKKGKGR